MLSATKPVRFTYLPWENNLDKVLRSQKVQTVELLPDRNGMYFINGCHLYADGVIQALEQRSYTWACEFAARWHF